jgi:hypothetical protein
MVRRARSESAVAEAPFVVQHRLVAAKLGDAKTRCAALLSLLLPGVGLFACDATVTSVGAWEQAVTQPQGGGGSAGSAAVAGSGADGGSGGVSGGSGGVSGSADPGVEAGAGAGGAPEPGTLGQYIEAEAGELSGGFIVGNDPMASAQQYIAAPPGVVADEVPGAALATYRFEVDQDGDYVIWGRIWSPGINSNRFWVQVDGGEWHRWRITVGTIWYWDDFHADLAYNDALVFPLTAGSHVLLIANEAPDTRLDRLYITAGGDMPPGNMTECDPPHSIDLGNPTCDRSCGAQAPLGMHTTCQCGEDRVNDRFRAYDCGGGWCCVVMP